MTQQRTQRGWWIAVLFAVTSFIGAGLLFVVQPLAAKLVLPYFGGSATVWSTSSLFFQVLLLVGYVYAHVATRRLGARWQPRAHLLLLAVPLVVLPIVLPAEAAPPADTSPVLWLLRTLMLLIGLPFAVLSATGPLIQRWYSWANGPRADDPYFLFAGSNMGSFVGLLAYPSLIEPNLTLTQQRWAWSVVFVVFLVLMATCALVVRASGQEQVSVDRDPQVASPSRRQYGLWVFWAFVPSSLMLAVTSHLSTDIAALPLLWVLPLAAYLASFVAAFARTSRTPPTGLLLVAIVVAVSTGVASSLVRVHFVVSLIALNVLAVGLVGYAAHSRLACSRPHPAHLTGFYLVVSVGGALGGVLNGVAAPILFDGVWEYWISIALVPLLTIGASGARAAQRGKWAFSGRRTATLVVAPVSVLSAAAVVAYASDAVDSTQLASGFVGATVLAIVVRLAQRTPFLLGVTVALAGVAMGVVHESGSTATARTFYGTYRVTENDDRRTLIHGTTVHGTQMKSPALRDEPTTYYARQGPFGDVMRAAKPSDLGVVGLGAGAIAAYSDDVDQMVFYEIDPRVRDFATNTEYFSYLHDSRAEVEVRIGDGRLGLANDASGEYDLLVLDAFSSDSIPVHLMTREAMRSFMTKVVDGGALAVHISNRVLDLRPVMAGHAADLGVSAVIGNGDNDGIATASTWVVLSRNQQMIDTLLDSADWEPLETSRIVDWTDDYSSILSVLH